MNLHKFANEYTGIHGLIMEEIPTRAVLFVLDLLKHHIYVYFSYPLLFSNEVVLTDPSHGIQKLYMILLWLYACTSVLRYQEKTSATGPSGESNLGHWHDEDTLYPLVYTYFSFSHTGYSIFITNY